jgi:hypothetical protein
VRFDRAEVTFDSDVLRRRNKGTPDCRVNYVQLWYIAAVAGEPFEIALGNVMMFAGLSAFVVFYGISVVWRLTRSGLTRSSEKVAPAGWPFTSRTRKPWKSTASTERPRLYS